MEFQIGEQGRLIAGGLQQIYKAVQHTLHCICGRLIVFSTTYGALTHLTSPTSGTASYKAAYVPVRARYLNVKLVI
jgi:hypothetical protein